jgi:phage shock protein C
MRERHHHHHHYHNRDRDRYAYQAGDPGPGPNIHRLRRNTRRGKIAGVCAGLAEHFGWNLKLTRVGLILATIFAFPLPIFAYIAAAVFIKPDDGRSGFADAEEERFWRTFSTRPKATYSELKHRFRALDARLADIERTVTSEEYGLKKAFSDLERGA